MTIRDLLAGVLAFVVMGTSVPTIAANVDSAAAYPNKPVRWVVPFPPGAANDLFARLVGQRLSEAWGQQFVIDNRAGAGGSVGALTVAKASPDGYTLLVANPGPSINNVVIRRKPLYEVSDFAPVALMAYAPLLLVARPTFPTKDARELITYARANPGKVNWASSGVGSAPHIGLVLFQVATGINVVHVPYKGGALALLDVAAGRVDVLYSNSSTAEAQIKAGRVKMLGVADSKRQAVLPNVPCFAELGIKGADAKLWVGMAAPAKTPRAIINKLNRGVNKALEVPEIRNQMEQLGFVVQPGTVEEFEAFVKEEVERLTKLVKSGAIPQE